MSPGDRVAWAMQLGSAASVAVLPAQALVPVPESVELDVAAAAMLQAMTAHFLVHDTYLCDEGTVALVHAAAGGVGQLLVQLLKAKGSTVVATAGSADKLQIARSRGADHVIGYHEHDPESLASAVREAAGRGVDVVYDGVGQSTFDASLASLRPRGLMVLFGAASGPVPPSTRSVSTSAARSTSPAPRWATTSPTAISSCAGRPRSSSSSAAGGWRSRSTRGVR